MEIFFFFFFQWSKFVGVSESGCGEEAAYRQEEEAGPEPAPIVGVLRLLPRCQLALQRLLLQLVHHSWSRANSARPEIGPSSQSASSYSSHHSAQHLCGLFAFRPTCF